jgi:hypothetical protein
MKELIIERTPKTPEIDLNPFTGDLIFSGKSIPENAAKLYEPVFDWFTEYVHQAKPTTNLRLNLEYFNTATTIWLRKIIRTLIHINEPDYVLILHLYMHLEDYDELTDFDDIKDAFIAISDIDHVDIPCIGIKLYGTDDNSQIIKQKLIFLEN